MNKRSRFFIFATSIPNALARSWMYSWLNSLGMELPISSVHRCPVFRMSPRLNYLKSD
jgi:hypothetical protein